MVFFMCDHKIPKFQDGGVISEKLAKEILLGMMDGCMIRRVKDLKDKNDQIIQSSKRASE